MKKTFTKKKSWVSEKNQTTSPQQKNHANSKKRWGNEWVSEKITQPLHTKKFMQHINKKQPLYQKKLCNFQKNHTTSPPQKSCNLKKMTQPLHKKFITKTNATSTHKKACNLTTKKSWNLQKITQPLHKKLCNL